MEKRAITMGKHVNVINVVMKLNGNGPSVMACIRKITLNENSITGSKRRTKLEFTPYGELSNSLLLLILIKTPCRINEQMKQN